jgi:hypothetical protein
MTYPGTIVSILIDKSQHCNFVQPKRSKDFILLNSPIKSNKTFSLYFESIANTKTI